MNLSITLAGLAGAALSAAAGTSQPAKPQTERPVTTVADAVKAIEEHRDARPRLKLLNPGQVVQFGDYPEEAIQNEQQGTADIRLTVDAAGRVTACAVEKSSGSAILDAASCRAYAARARYEPLAGAAKPRVSHEQVSWRLSPDGRGRSRLGWFQRTKIAIRSDGSVASCKLESSELPDTDCSIPQPFPKKIAAYYVKAVGDPAKLIVEMRFSPEGEAAEPPQAQPGFPMRSAKLVVKSDGTLRSCEVLEAGTSPSDSVCREAGQYRFETLPDTPDATGIVRFWTYLEAAANP